LNDKEIVLTQEGLTKLEQELDELKSVHRREVNDRIRQAKEYGDLSENAEYEDAKRSTSPTKSISARSSKYAILRRTRHTSFPSSGRPKPTRQISASPTNLRWGAP
jgi:hypothetical protein